MFLSPHMSLNLDIYFAENLFFFEGRGVKSCAVGLEITTEMECKAACHSLGVSGMGKLSDGEHCYKRADGECRQDGGQLGHFRLICKGEGVTLSIINYY